MIMEQLYAEFLLWQCGFRTSETYNNLLNMYFLQDPDNNILLELEESSSHAMDTLCLFQHYWTYEHPEIDAAILGQTLFSALTMIYYQNTISIELFGRQCYQLWRNIPPSCNHNLPFYTLSYADDCLSWGDEAQTRSLYEQAFEFYN